MTGRVQSLRSNVAGNRPTGRQPGELYVNWADKALGVIDNTSTATDLLAVRMFATTANYNIGDFVLQGGNLYRAIAAVSAGAFNPAQWNKVQTAADMSGYLPIAGGTLTGPLIAPAGSTIVGYLPLAGGTMTGPIVLAADPAAPLQPATKQYADTKLAKLGVTDGSDAAAGQIGEVISSITGSAVSVPNATAVNVTSIPLTAGDWDVQGEVVIAIGTAAATLVAAAINSVSATIPAIPTPMGASRAQITASLTATANQSLGLATCRVSVAAAVTMYLIATANYASGSTTAQGKIWARRAR